MLNDRSDSVCMTMVCFYDLHQAWPCLQAWNAQPRNVSVCTRSESLPDLPSSHRFRGLICHQAARVNTRDAWAPQTAQINTPRSLKHKNKPLPCGPDTLGCQRVESPPVLVICDGANLSMLAREPPADRGQVLKPSAHVGSSLHSLHSLT